MARILTLWVMGLEVPVEMLLAIEHLVTSWNSASHALYHRLGDCRIHRFRARWVRDRDQAHSPPNFGEIRYCRFGDPHSGGDENGLSSKWLIKPRAPYQLTEMEYSRWTEEEF